MDTTAELLSKVEGRIGGMEELVKHQGEEMLAKLEAKFPGAKLEEPIRPNPDVASLEQAGVAAGITKMEIWDVPVGQALVGGFGAVFASELIDGFFVAQSALTKGVIKLAGAGIAIKWGNKLLGSMGSKAIALILAYDGLRQILPIDEWGGNVAGKIAARTGSGLAGKAGMGDAAAQAERVARTYYASIARRSG